MPLLPNSYIRVVTGAATGNPFTLPTDYQAENGTVTSNIESSPLAIKLSLGLYPVIETPATFDEALQTCESVYTVNADHVVLSYIITDKPLEVLVKESLQKVELALMQKIDDVVKQYNYDNIAEVGVYASTTNAYQSEAQAIVAWTASCWELFYALNAVTDVNTFMTELPVFN